MCWTLCSVSCHFLVEFVVILRFKCQVVFWLIFLAYVCLIVGFRSQVLKFMCLHCLYTSCDNWSHCNNWFGSTCLHRGNSWSVSFLQVLLCFHTHHVWSILQIETLLQFLGSAAVVQLVVTKLLYAEVHIYFLSSLVQLVWTMLLYAEVHIYFLSSLVQLKWVNIY